MHNDNAGVMQECWSHARRLYIVLQLKADRDIHPRFIAYFFDIGDLCYGQLIPVKTTEGISQPASHDHVTGSSLEIIEVICFLEVDG